jgi:hypothetical protein
VQPLDLRDHKRVEKRLRTVPNFAQMKRGKLPKPFDRMGGRRLTTSSVVEVSSSHCVCFVVKDGPLLSDSAFYGWLLCRLSNGSLSPLFEFHWHPSHKGFHAKLPCGTTDNYTNRQLPGAPELDLRTDAKLDPREPGGREALIRYFCVRTGIMFGEDGQVNQGTLWKRF